MVIEWFVLTEVIIVLKRGSEDPQWTVWKLSYYLELPLRRVFLEDLYGAGGASGSGAGASSTTGSTTGSGAGASSTTGSTTGSGAGAGAAGAGAAFLPPNRSPNLDIAFIEYF